MRLRSALPAVRSIPFAAAAAFAAVFAVIACSSQGEGEHCDMSAGNMGTDDCQSGLVCTNIGTMLNVCCPVNRAQSSTTICSNNSNTIGGEAGHDAPDASGASGEAGEASQTDDAATTGDATTE